MICIWTAGLTNNFSSGTAVQRIKFLSSRFETILLYPSWINIDNDIKFNATIVKVGKNGLLKRFNFIRHSINYIKNHDCSVIITQPDFSTISGFFSKFKYRKLWIVDIWDHPLLPFYVNLRDGKYFRALVHLLSRELFNLMLKASDGIISNIHPRAIKKDFDNKDVCDVPNGVLYEKLIQLRKEFPEYPSNVIGYVGMLRYDRGLDMILNIARFLRKKHIDFKIELIGPMEEKDKRKFQVQLRENNLNSFVKWYGKLEWEVAMNYVTKWDICLFPFDHKPELEYIYPLKVLEYMALGKIVISSDLKGVSRIIDNEEDGVVMSSLSPEDWAEKIEHILTNWNVYEKISYNASKKAARFSWDLIHNRLYAWLNKKIVEKMENDVE